MLSVKDLQLGYSDALNYTQRQNKNMFNEVFVRNTFLDELTKQSSFFLIGEKGTGKTAYATYLCNNNYKDISATMSFLSTTDCNGVQREHNKKLNNGLPILHKVPPKRDYGRYFCIMAEKGGTSHGGLTEKLSPFFHAKKQEVNAYGR